MINGVAIQTSNYDRDNVNYSVSIVLLLWAKSQGLIVENAGFFKFFCKFSDKC